MTLENTAATVKWFNQQKGFGFFRVVDPATGIEQPDAFVHISWLEKQGFSKDDMAENTPAVIHYGTNRVGKVVALAVHSIGEKQATASSATVAAKSSAKVAPLLKVVDRGEGWVIKKDHANLLYILEQDGEEPQEFGALNGPNGAREAAGKVIEPPKPKGHGVATNDPKISQSMHQKKAS